MGKLEEHVRNLLTPLDRQGLDDVADDIAELESKLGTAEKAVAFFASVIKSGEPWTGRCEEVLREVLPP